MTDFEMLRGRPDWCEDAIAQRLTKELGAIAGAGFEEEVDEEYLALRAAKKCAFSTVVLKNRPEGPKDIAKNLAERALDVLPVSNDEPLEPLTQPKVKCHNCDLCKQRILVVKDESVRSFMTTPMIPAGSTHI